MNQSDTITDLAKSLAKAQAKMAGAKKDSKNPHLNSKYADLSSVWDACREALTENGLSVVQTLDDANCENDQICVVTTLLHESGQWIGSRLRMVASKFERGAVQVNPQTVGSAITYARRYALAAMVGVCPEDDDAEAAMNRPSQEPAQAARPASRPAQQRPASIQAGGPPPKQAQPTEEEIKKSLVAQIANLAGIAKLSKPQTVKILGVHPANASVDELDAGKVSLVAFNNRFLNKQLTPDDKILLGLEPGELAAAS